MQARGRQRVFRDGGFATRAPSRSQWKGEDTEFPPVFYRPGLRSGRRVRGLGQRISGDGATCSVSVSAGGGTTALPAIGIPAGSSSAGLTLAGTTSTGGGTGR